MEIVFLRILNMSITAGWVVFAVLVLRILLRKAPKAICCALRAFVGIRPICPSSIELACDGRLVRDMEGREKKSYAETLLACSMPRHSVSACPPAFGEAGVKARVKAVLNYKKPAFWVVVTAIVCCVGVVLCFLTDPVPGSGEAPQGQRFDYDSDNLREQEDFAAGDEDLDKKASDRKEEALDTAITAAIMEDCGTDSASEYFCWAGHVIFSRQELGGSPLEGDAGNGEKVTAYCLAMYQELELFEESIDEKAFSYFPAALTFCVGADGGYVLEEFWKPQGAGSMEALEAALMEKFPMEVAEEVLEARRSQPFFDRLKQDCYSKAVEYGGVDTDKAVEGLLEIIESSPAESSYSGSYLAAHPVEYHTLAYYGDYTVKYILAQFLKGGQTGLREDLMITIVAGLTGEQFFGEYADTGQEYFDAWLEEAKETEMVYGMEWMKENRPYQWMALDMQVQRN